ncbi:lipoxygenase homology domain-containing 1-like [Octopus vulgaris]|uniref:Lipoxygenase homology domain-containing 1-like n=1 Tax=Octopus vulgaris TaxID=6645 RepID=A0AA36FB89_OCTVU|nr:lipoxygenase homology domain-containing 1-like [Octopus vulgaris]
MSVILWITSIFLFSCHGAIGKKSPEEAIVYWTFIFTTATDTIADSDANQRFILQGTLAVSDTIYINENNRSSRFQKGQVDEFNVTTRDIGRLTNITFWNDRTGKVGPIWNIEKTSLTKPPLYTPQK